MVRWSQVVVCSHRHKQAMDLSSLFPLPQGVRFLRVRILSTTVHIEATSQTATGACPRCRAPSDRVHSSYTRKVMDVAWAGRPVSIRLQVRKFRCTNGQCPQRVFAERFTTCLRPWARKTSRMTDLLSRLGLALGGRGTARIAPALGMPVGERTVLRALMQGPDPPVPPVEALGVDDFAFRRGRTYGTILVDVEEHRVIDLLPDRSQVSFALWLQQHPEVRLISRDRGGDYAAAARLAAPHAEQIADRFHLLKNAGEALERCLLRQHALLRQAARALVPEDAVVRTSKRSPSDQQRERERRAVRQATYEQVVALHQQGVAARRIAQQLGIARGTVLTHLRALCFPETVRRPRPRQLDPYLPYLRERWNAGEYNARALWREIRAQGYPGADVQVRRLVNAWRAPAETTTGSPAPVPAAKEEVIYYSAQKTRWLLMKAPADRSQREAAFIAELQQRCPQTATAQHLLTSFHHLVTERCLERLDPWLEECEQASISEFVGFAQGIRRDYAAVANALRYSYSHGPVEGAVNRLKMLKRQMFGRAGFALLRRRVLAYPALAP
jgi:transposase